MSALGVVRNRIGTAAVFAVQRHLANIFHLSSKTAPHARRQSEARFRTVQV